MAKPPKIRNGASYSLYFNSSIRLAIRTTARQTERLSLATQKRHTAWAEVGIDGKATKDTQRRELFALF